MDGLIAEYVGEVRNGVIVLEGQPALPEGTRVFVRAVEGVRKEDLTTLSQRLLAVAGKAEGLPSDLADNHDHYLHGQPKRTP